MTTCQEVTEACLEKMKAEIVAELKDVKACLQEAGACLESKVPSSMDLESIVVHEEVPKEEAAVETVRALRERYGDQHIALGHHQQLKKCI
jgi:hypothetical protein